MRSLSCRPLKTFLVELAMGLAAEKHGVQLDPAWKLPKMRYKGETVQPQLLRLERGPVGAKCQLL